MLAGLRVGYVFEPRFYARNFIYFDDFGILNKESLNFKKILLILLGVKTFEISA